MPEPTPPNNMTPEAKKTYTKPRLEKEASQGEKLTPKQPTPAAPGPATPPQVELSQASVDRLAEAVGKKSGAAETLRSGAEAAAAGAALLDEAKELFGTSKPEQSTPPARSERPPEPLPKPAPEIKESVQQMTWKRAEGILESYADKVATGKKITAAEEAQSDRATEERDRMVALAKAQGILDRDMKIEAAAQMDEIIKYYPTALKSGQNYNPREALSVAVERDLQAKGEPEGELAGIRRSWYDGIYRNADQRILEEQVAFRKSLNMPENPGLNRELVELQKRIGVLNWGGITQPTKERLTNIGQISAEWQALFGPNKDAYARAAQSAGRAVGNGMESPYYHAHSLKDYEAVGEGRGIFNDEPGKGLYTVIKDPIVTKVAQGGDFTSGKFDLFIELNKFAEGKGDKTSFDLTRKLLEYALPGLDNEMQRWGVMELAKFMYSIWNLASSADYKKFAGEKNLITDIDPRPIANLINSVPEMKAAFGHYYEMFSDPKLLRHEVVVDEKTKRPVKDPETGKPMLRPRNIMTEAELRKEDITLAKNLGCCEGIVRATRHFVTDFGVFPAAFTEGQKMVNRYPALFDMDLQYDETGVGKGKTMRDTKAAVLTPGIGFDLVEIQGSRGVLGPMLVAARASGDYTPFLTIYSDTTAAGNTDPAWSGKMWNSFDSVHDLIDNYWKNAFKQMKFIAETNPERIRAQDQVGVFPEINYLVDQKVLTPKPYKLVSIEKITASAEGTRTLKPNQVEAIIQYLFNLKAGTPGQPDGAVENKDWNIRQLFTPLARLIIESFRTSRIRAQEGLEGAVDAKLPKPRLSSSRG